MAVELATAYVRIRPNMAGFRAETETGVRSAFSELAKVAGVALGGAAAFEFGKHIVEGAADTQKQVEAVRAEFGRAGNAVLKFGSDAAAGLGISKNLADSTSARFGILFRNLGIGQRQGALMTVGLQKLAGSIATIRNIDPATVLQNLPNALAGNVRSLRTLGLNVDASQVKIAAFKLGLTSTIKQALTPAQRALAIYALATAHAGELQAQAKTHANDLANVQARLTAEWKNAKDTLGEALLPTFAKLAKQLADWLQRMQKSGALQRDFNAIAKVTVAVVHGVIGAVTFAARIWKDFTKAVGGGKDAVVLLLTVLAVNKIRKIAGAVANDLVANGIKKIGPAAVKGSAEYDASMTTMKVASIGLGATIRSAIVTTGIGAIVVAVSFAVEYIITHWAQVKRVTVALAAGIVATWQGLKTVLIGIATIIGGAMATQLTLPLRALLKVAGFVGGLFDKVFGTNIKGSLDKATGFIKSFSTTLVSTGLSEVRKGAGQIASGFGKAWSDAMAKSAADPTAKDALKKSGRDMGKDVADAAAATAGAGAANVTAAVNKAMRAAIAASNQRIANSIAAAKNNLVKIGNELATTISDIQKKLGGAAGALAGSPQGQAFAKLKALVASGAPSFAIARANQELSSQLQNVGKTQANSVKTQIANLTDAFNQGHLSLKSFDAQIAKLLAKSGATYKTAAKAGGRAFADTFKAQVSGLKSQAQAISVVPARLRGVGGGGGASDIKIIRPLDRIRVENAKIAAQASRERARIAKASERTASILNQVKSTQVGPLPGYGKTPPGHAAKKAHASARAGVQP